MTTLLNLLYTAPIVVGMIIAITLVAMFAPWRLYWECVLMVVAMPAVLVMYLFNETLRSFKNRMRKPASWEDDFPELFI